MSPVQLSKVEVREKDAAGQTIEASVRYQLVGESLSSGSEYKSATTVVKVLLETATADVWCRLLITSMGWRFRLELDREVPDYLGMSVDDWSRMKGQVERHEATLDVPVSIIKPDLRDQELLDTDTVALGDVLRISVNLRHGTMLDLEESGVFGRSYDVIVGTVKDILMGDI